MWHVMGLLIGLVQQMVDDSGLDESVFDNKDWFCPSCIYKMNHGEDIVPKQLVDLQSLALFR